ncbi:two-component system response regulator [Streptomyces sp. NPDC091292]|uniref:response regulator n=1 Tax=Streptomyces sp. NPDC091292 TaxID=3365991 RepID=UPI003818026F
MPSDAKILIVDDHEDTLYALESALAPLGHEVTCATNGDAALKEVLRGHVGLLLLDVRMPGVSGLDVVRYMRRVEQTQSIPIVLLTGFGLDAALSAEAFRLGVADLLLKPIDPLALCTKVSYLFSAHQRLLATERELRELRAARQPAVRGGPTRPRGLVRPHVIDPRVPPQRDVILPQDPAQDPAPSGG